MAALRQQANEVGVMYLSLNWALNLPTRRRRAGWNKGPPRCMPDSLEGNLDSLDIPT